jgi:hypothetical protein
MLVGEGELSIPWKDGSPTTRGENNKQEQQATINQRSLKKFDEKESSQGSKSGKEGTYVTCERAGPNKFISCERHDIIFKTLFCIRICKMFMSGKKIG